MSTVKIIERARRGGEERVVIGVAEAAFERDASQGERSRADLLVLGVGLGAPGYRRVVLGAAAARYLESHFELAQPLVELAGQDLRPDIAEVVLDAVANAAEWVRYEKKCHASGCGPSEDEAIYSGDIARVIGDDPAQINEEHDATATSTRLAAPPPEHDAASCPRRRVSRRR